MIPRRLPHLILLLGATSSGFLLGEDRSWTNSSGKTIVATLVEIAGEKSSTIVFSIPINLMDAAQKLLESQLSPSAESLPPKAQ